MRDRFGKLTALTRGAALVGIGVGLAGCTKSEPPQPIHVNGPPVHVNAIPTHFPTLLDASAPNSILPDSTLPGSTLPDSKLPDSKSP